MGAWEGGFSALAVEVDDAAGFSALTVKVDDAAGFSALAVEVDDAAGFSTLAVELDDAAGPFPCGRKPIQLQASKMNSKTTNNNTNVMSLAGVRIRFMMTSSFALETDLANVCCDFPSIRQIALVINFTKSLYKKRDLLTSCTLIKPPELIS